MTYLYNSDSNSDVSKSTPERCTDTDKHSFHDVILSRKNKLIGTSPRELISQRSFGWSTKLVIVRHLSSLMPKWLTGSKSIQPLITIHLNGN